MNAFFLATVAETRFQISTTFWLVATKLILSMSFVRHLLQVVDSELPLVANTLKDKQVIVTIPGDYSRKPPVGGK